MYEEKWWVACVIQVDEDDNTEVNFLHPQGPSQSFRYPTIPNTLTIAVESALLKVDPRSTRRDAYTLSRKESRAATEKLRLKLTQRIYYACTCTYTIHHTPSNTVYKKLVYTVTSMVYLLIPSMSQKIILDTKPY